MKKKYIKKKKAPSYAFGIEQIAANIQPIGDVTGNIGTAISTNANDTSKGAVAGAAFGGLGKGASMGAQLGSVAGPMGTAIGGAVGAVGGLLGGIFTGRKKRLAALKRQRQQAQTNETMAALGNQAEMEQEYCNDNGLAYSFENGGVLPNMAWVDNNEIIRDNAGNLIKVPDNKPGTDNHLINSTHLDSVLSDKLKRPGTNKTFAQEGEKLTKMTKGSKGKDRFAKASDELNKLHANQMYNTLLSEQAAVKAKKGIKPKVKGIAPAYEIGKEKINLLETKVDPLKATIPSLSVPQLSTLPTETPDLNLDFIKKRNQAALLERQAKQDKLNNILSKISDFDPSIATLAAGMFNQPEYESQVYNPYAGAVNRALARRRINIEPTLAANRRSRAINNRNLANLSPNTGANLAARTQSAVSEYAQNADLYANRDNANNQYLADAANMMNNLGQQFAQNAVYTNDVNARNRAAVRNARNKSIENYNKWYQNKQLMKNQMERDKALYPLLKDYLSYGIKNELLTGLDTRYGK